MSTFDVWVMRFEAGEVPPADRLARAFGLDDTTARSLAANLPRVVKHGLAAPQAGEMRRVLESIGAEVECRPAGRPKGTTNPHAGAYPKQSATSPRAGAYPRKAGTDPRAGTIPKKGATNPRAGIFQKPDDGVFAGRVSAIDPFAPASAAGVPRPSVDEASPSEPPNSPSEISGVVRPPAAVPPRGGFPPRSVDDAIRARALERQKKTFVRRAAGAIASGLVIAVIGLVIGNSVFLGSADWFGIGFDGLAIYFLGSGGFDLYSTLKS
ncbi:MAG: hypothetical protein AAF997_10785 [Myxococcota bacterium]